MFARMGALAAAVLSMGILAAGPARAQDVVSDAMMNEILCVYDEVVKFGDEDFFALADIQLLDIQEGEDFDRLTAMVADVTDGCVAQHAWDEQQTLAALEIGMQGVVSDTLEADLFILGLDEEDMLTIEDTMVEMSDEDMDALYLGTWGEDAAVRARLDKLMVDAGLPGDAETLDLVHRYCEAQIVGLVLTLDWADVYAE